MSKVKELNEKIKRNIYSKKYSKQKIKKEKRLNVISLTLNNEI